jgi:hypothetical protein
VAIMSGADRSSPRLSESAGLNGVRGVNSGKYSSKGEDGESRESWDGKSRRLLSLWKMTRLPVEQLPEARGLV